MKGHSFNTEQKVEGFYSPGVYRKRYLLLLEENVWYVHPFIKILMNKLGTLQNMSHLLLVLQLSFLNVYMISAGNPVNPFPGSRAVNTLI